MSHRIFVGNLPYDIRERELDDVFYRYGRIRDVKATSNGYAFVDFDHSRDAEDAVHDMDGRIVFGRKIRVEASNRRDSGRYNDRNDRRRRDFDSNKPKKGDYRVIFGNLPDNTSWQDLKDFAREAGPVAFTKTEHGGFGVAEYFTADAADKAVANLNNQEMKGYTITVRLDENPNQSASRNRDTRDRSRSRSGQRRSRRSRSRSRSRNRSRSRSPRRRDSRSRSRSVERENTQEGTQNSPRQDSPKQDSP